MFRQDRVNKTTRANAETYVRLRTAGAATGNRKKEVFAGRVSPNEASETRPTRLNVRSTCSNHGIYFGAPLLPTQYRHTILHDTYIIYTPRRREARDEPLIHPPFKASYLLTFYYLIT